MAVSQFDTLPLGHLRSYDGRMAARAVVVPRPSGLAAGEDRAAGSPSAVNRRPVLYLGFVRFPPEATVSSVGV